MSYANTYGSVANVAAMTMMYTNGGTYDATTNPTAVQVQVWLDQFSAIVNTAFAEYGFAIPITQPDSLLAVQSYVEGLAAEMCQVAHASGRFFTDRAIASGVSPFSKLRQDALTWVDLSSAGFEAMGAARAQVTSETQIGFRNTDEVGDPTSPITQRKAFGNNFEDWTNAQGPQGNNSWPTSGDDN